MHRSNRLVRMHRSHALLHPDNHIWPCALTTTCRTRSGPSTETSPSSSSPPSPSPRWSRALSRRPCRERWRCGATTTRCASTRCSPRCSLSCRGLPPRRGCLHTRTACFAAASTGPSPTTSCEASPIRTPRTSSASARSASAVVSEDTRASCSNTRRPHAHQHEAHHPLTPHAPRSRARRAVV